MLRTEIKELFKSMDSFGGKEITVGGWVRTIRTSKSLGFIELNDGSTFRNLQVVFEDGKINNFKEIGKSNVGSALVVKGELVLNPCRFY